MTKFSSILLNKDTEQKLGYFNHKVKTTKKVFSSNFSDKKINRKDKSQKSKPYFHLVFHFSLFSFSIKIISNFNFYSFNSFNCFNLSIKSEFHTKYQKQKLFYSLNNIIW